MNEKLQYAEMLDLPESTCTVRVKSPKKTFFKKKKRPAKEVKEELLKMVNEKEMAEEEKEVSQNIAEEENPVPIESDIKKEPEKRRGWFSRFFSEKSENREELKDETVIEENYTVSVKEKKKEKKPLKISVIGVELAVIALLIGTIAVTGAVIPNSGIKVFMESVFGNNKQASAPDNRKYSDFSATLPVSAANLSVNDGIMTISGTESVYAPCAGEITSIVKSENGKYDMKISHNDNFVTVFTGLDYAYFSTGDTVYPTIPVGRVSGGGATACFTGGDGTVITDYTLSGSAVVWAV